MSIQNILDRWENHADLNNFSLKPIYTNLMFDEEGVEKTLEHYGIFTGDLLAADEDTQKQVLPHLTAIDDALIEITKLIEGFVLATLYDDAEEDDEEVISLFRDMRESVYDEYRSIKERLDQVGEIVGEVDENNL
jgi:hypothetical protein